MDSFTDRLGDLLSTVLETGKVPESTDSGTAIPHNDSRISSFSDGTVSSVDKFYEHMKTASVESEQTGTIIRNGAYRMSCPVPPAIAAAYTMFGCTPDRPFADIRREFRKRIKKTHPDRQNYSEDVYKIAQNQSELLIEAYTNIKQWIASHDSVLNEKQEDIHAATKRNT